MQLANALLTCASRAPGMAFDLGAKGTHNRFAIDTETQLGYVAPQRSVINGVPVFSLRGPGMMTATLIFRVGQIDESLPTRGITHLVEHLAASSLSEGPNWWRVHAEVEQRVTRFSLRGSPADLTSFFSDLTTRLSDLPTVRLETERRILRTEAVHSNFGSAKKLWSHRYGARGLGLCDFQEYGQRWLGAAAVGEWASERFNADNAVMWISGEIPEGLRLNLRPESRFPLPPGTDSTGLRTPAVYQQGSAGVALNMLVPSGSTAYVVAYILDDRIRRRLRHQEGVAYHAGAKLELGGATGTASVTATADSIREHAAQAAASIVSILRDLAANGHTSEDFERMKAAVRASRSEMIAYRASLDDASLKELGAIKRFISWDEFDAHAEALTPREVAEYVESALSTAMLAVPHGVSCDIEGFGPLSLGNGWATAGSRVFASASGGPGDAIDYSKEGVSLVEADGSVRGMRWQGIAVAPWWADGTRVLVGEDGIGFRIVPEHWSNPEPLLEALRANVPPDRWVPMDWSDDSAPEANTR